MQCSSPKTMLNLLGKNFFLDQLYKNNRSKKGNRKKKKLQAHRREIIFYQILQNMCGGYYKVIHDYLVTKNVCLY